MTTILQPAPSDMPGTVPSKFFDPHSNMVMCRKMVQTDVKNGAVNSLTKMGLGKYFRDVDGLRATEGRRIYPPKNSETEVWKPLCNPIEAPGSHHPDPPRGLRRVPEKEPVIPRRSEMRHIRQVESKEETYDLPSGVGIVLTPKGGRAADIPAQEVCLEQVMGHKKVVSGLLAKRNGIGMAGCGGDKPYKHPEYKTGFYAERGITVGSTFVRGSFPVTLRRNATSWMQFLGDPNRKKGKTWKERRKEEVAQEVNGVVESLAEWETATLKECEDAKYTELTDSEGEES